MNCNKKTILAALALSVALSVPAYAEPQGNGGGKPDKHEYKSNKSASKEYKREKYEQQEKHESQARYDDNRTHRDAQGNAISYNDYFRDSHRSAVHDYYAKEFRAGNCPPGLAKKHNGCLPPGQAKKWRVGQPLANNVQYYPLPPAVVSSLGQPPAGYQYVRVDNDVLLLGTATRMVIDAIRNFGF